MRPGEEGRLYANNPEGGYFGVAPGTSAKSNPNALASIQRDTIFTNVAVTDDNQPWCEGLDDRVPAKDWQGSAYVAGNGKSAPPNPRFPVSAKQLPSYSSQSDAAQGVPLSALRSNP